MKNKINTINYYCLLLLFLIVCNTAFSQSTIKEGNETCNTKDFDKVVHKFYSKYFVVDMNMYYPHNGQTSLSEKLNTSINYETKKYDDISGLVKLIELQSKDTVGNHTYTYSYTVSTNRYGEIFMTFRRNDTFQSGGFLGIGNYSNNKDIHYTLYSTKVKLSSSSLLRIDFDLETPLIWLTTCDNTTNRSDISIDEFEKTMAPHYGDEKGEGFFRILDKKDELIKNSNFSFFSGQNHPEGLEPVVTFVGKRDPDVPLDNGNGRTLLEINRTVTDDDLFLKASMYDYEPDDVLPEEGKLYYIQNKKTKSILSSNINGNVVTAALDPVNTAPLQLWRIIETDNGQIQLQNKGNDKVLENGISTGLGLTVKVSDANKNLQKWKLEPDIEDFVSILNANLSIENSANGIQNNEITENDEQKWTFVPFTGNILPPVAVVDAISTKAAYTVKGYTYDPDNGGESLNYSIKIDDANVLGQDNEILKFKADLIRRDVNTEQHITGDHGFEFEVPYQYFDGNNHSIKVTAWDAAIETVSTVSNSKTFKYDPCVISVTSLSAATDFSSLAYGKSGANHNLIALKDGKPVQWNGSEFIPIGNPVAINFKSIDVDAEGDFWAIATDGNIYKNSSQTPNAWNIVTLTIKDSLLPIPLFEKVSCSSENNFGLMFLDAAGVIYYFDGLSTEMLKLSVVTNTNTNISFKDVNIGEDGSFWAIELDSNIYVLDENEQWTKVVDNANAKAISIGNDSALFWLTTTGQIKKWNGNDGGYSVANFNTGTTTGRTSFVVLDADTVTVVNNGKVYTNCNVNSLFEASINTIYPTSGTLGSLITIRGTNFKNVSSVKIGNTPAIVISNEGEKLVAMVMPGTSGDSNAITIVTNTGSTVSQQLFSVEANTIPTTQKGNDIVASDAVGTAPKQGKTVAISADGTIVLVGSSEDDAGKGAVWVYTRNEGNWTQQTKLTVEGLNSNARFGSSLAISADGNTAMVGGTEDNWDKGAVWIFTRENETWSQGSKLTIPSSITTTNLGVDLSLSADGNTALVAAEGSVQISGVALIFTRNEGVWSHTNLPLTNNGTTKVSSVAISADSKIAVVHTFDLSNNHGKLWFFKKEANGWSLFNTQAPSSTNIVNYKTSLALNADGTVALLGFGGANAGQGATWLYRRNSNSINSEFNLNLGSEVVYGVGTSVVLSSDGNTAFIGTPGNATALGGYYVFKKGTSAWTVQGAKNVASKASNNTSLGTSLALSADGTTLLAGAPDANTATGLVLPFIHIPQPTIISFNPSRAPIGDLVEVVGENFEGIQSVKVNGIATEIIYNDENTVKIMLMPGTTSGAIAITTSRGTSSSNTNFTVIPNKTPNLQLGDKLVGQDIYQHIGEVVTQGSAIAISADGKVAIVGAKGYSNEKGAALIYKRTDKGWRQMDSKLSGTSTGGRFGQSVAINADGNRVLVGAPGTGEAKIFSYNEKEKSWDSGKQLFVSESNTAIRLGISVGLSADGNVAIVGGVVSNVENALWVFKYNKTSDSWIQVQKLEKSGARDFGSHVVISADAATIAVGVTEASQSTKGIYIYKYNKDVEPNVVEEIKHIETKNDAGNFGLSLSINANGKTIVVGDPSYPFRSASVEYGKAWWFNTVDGSNWESKQIYQDGNLNLFKSFGRDISLSADGKTAAIGWLNSSDNSNYTSIYSIDDDQSGTLLSTNSLTFLSKGGRIVLSAEGSNLLAGDPYDNNSLGAVWAYNAQPSLNILKTTVPDAEKVLDLELTSYEGNISNTISFVIRAQNLTNNIILRAPEGIEMSTNATFSGGGKRYLQLSRTAEAYDGTIYIRIASFAPKGVSEGAISVISDGMPEKSIKVVYTVSEIRRGLSSIHDGTFTTTYGDDATVQNIDFIGLNLTEENMNIQATGEFEISTTGNAGDFSKNIILPKLGGEVYLRLVSNLNAGTYTGKLTASSNNLNLEELNLQGIVSKAPLVLTLSAQSKMGGQEWPVIKTFVASNGITVTGFKKGEIFEEIDLTVGDGRLANAPANTYISSITYASGKIVAGGTDVVNNYVVDTLQGNLSANLLVVSQPTITMSTGDLGAAGALNITLGTVVASSSLSISILGSNLVGNITTTAPTGYELSTSSNFTAANSTLTLSKTDTSYSGNIYIRLKATTGVGTYSGNITFSSTGATNLNVPVLSNQVLLRPVIHLDSQYVEGPLNSIYGTANTYKLRMNISGVNLVGNITATAPTGYELSTSSSFTSANSTLTLTRSGSTYSGSIYLRLKAQLSAGTYGGIMNFKSQGATDITLLLNNNVISKAPLTVTISNVTKKVGETWGEQISRGNGITVTGFKNGESFAALDLTTSILVRPHNANPQYWDRCVWYNHNNNNIAAYGRNGKGPVLDDYYVTNTGNPETIAGVTITRDGTDWYDNVSGISFLQNGTVYAFFVTLNYPQTYLNLSNITQAWVGTIPLTIEYVSSTRINFKVSIPYSFQTYTGELFLKNASGVRILNHNLQPDYVTLPYFRYISSRSSVTATIDDVFIDNTVSITEGLTVYPNPTDNELYINYLPKETGELVLSLWTILGSEVITKTITGTKDVAINHTFYLKDSNLASGMYLLKLSNKGETLSTKVILE